MLCRQFLWIVPSFISLTGLRYTLTRSLVIFVSGLRHLRLRLLLQSRLIHHWLGRIAAYLEQLPMGLKLKGLLLTLIFYRCKFLFQKQITLLIIFRPVNFHLSFGTIVMGVINVRLNQFLWYECAVAGWVRYGIATFQQEFVLIVAMILHLKLLWLNRGIFFTLNCNSFPIKV